MAQQVIYTTGSETAQPVMTYQPMDAAQPMAYADPGAVTYVDENGQPIQYVMEGAPLAYDMGGQPITYIQGADGLPVASSMVLGSPYGYSPYATPPLDHSQGKWFAPGEELPPGFIPVAHPEGHLEPQEAHAMTDAVKALKGFAGSAPPVEADKKKSKKKRTTGWC